MAKKKSKITPLRVIGFGLIVVAGWFGYKTFKAWQERYGHTFMGLPEGASQHSRRVRQMAKLARRSLNQPDLTPHKVLPNGMTVKQARSYTNFLKGRQKPTTWKHYSPNSMGFAVSEVVK